MQPGSRHFQDDNLYQTPDFIRRLLFAGVTDLLVLAEYSWPTFICYMLVYCMETCDPTSNTSPPQNSHLYPIRLSTGMVGTPHNGAQRGVQTWELSTGMVGTPHNGHSRCTDLGTPHNGRSEAVIDGHNFI